MEDDLESLESLGLSSESEGEWKKPPTKHSVKKEKEKKGRSQAQIAAFEKAQAKRLENAKKKEQKIKEVKETLKLETKLRVEEKEQAGIDKLQNEQNEIEKKIMDSVKSILDKRDEDAKLKKKQAAEERAAKKALKEKEKNDLALQKEIETKETEDAKPIKKDKKKKEPKIVYESSSSSEEEVIVVKKKKKQSKVLYEGSSDDEIVSPIKNKPTPQIERQPQIIKTNQIRFF